MVDYLKNINVFLRLSDTYLLAPTTFVVAKLYDVDAWSEVL